MKLFTGLALCGLGLTTAIFSVQGCSSDPAVTSDAGPGGGGASKRPPGKEGAATTSTDLKYYALKTIQLGDTDRGGAPSQTCLLYTSPSPRD